MNTLTAYYCERHLAERWSLVIAAPQKSQADFGTNPGTKL
jgi:hypothetical protein